jgi:tetratricopeptide (TPR) repeat protein
MSNKYFAIVWIILNLFLGLQQARAQNGINDISQIKYFYDNLRFEEAIEFGQEYLNESTELGPKQLAYIHQYLAFSFFNIGQADSARVHFLSLLSINPDIKLDPLATSPKILDFFNQTKKDFREINDQKKFFSYPEYIFLEDKRPSAAWRSALLPGWGQFYKGQPTRGYIYAGAFISSAVILGISVINENKYQDRYLNSGDPEEIKNNYDKYNSWSKIRRISTISTVGIWLLSFADALWSDYPKIDLNITGILNSNVSLLSFRYFF